MLQGLLPITVALRRRVCWQIVTWVVRKPCMSGHGVRRSVHLRSWSSCTCLGIHAHHEWLPAMQHLGHDTAWAAGFAGDMLTAANTFASNVHVSRVNLQCRCCSSKALRRCCAIPARPRHLQLPASESLIAVACVPLCMVPAALASSLHLQCVRSFRR